MSFATEETFDPNAVGQQFNEGELPSLVDLADEPSQGAWKSGWYRATILDGYASRKGTQFATSDKSSKAGDSRNLVICLAVQSTDGKETRNPQHQLNYRFEDLTAARIASVKEARAEFKGMQKWPGAAADLQRSSLSIGKLGSLSKAIGLGYKSTNVGINPQPLVGQQLDVRIGVDENGFNDVREFIKAGEKVKK